ncbi:hypothetical protein AQI95_35890 [Streptomyces yokosukanensis]|uniref:Uncharacterized protein n=1 Tax=Streptomyces yokosukanensis TaxID=67386 RepID=A0A101NV55_9ACTN|nr:hypothetical protein [Streptomyces yokosukanensis]KUM99901.1 hypothetical protein AQI95_35890 [Streptomyces yokosukanensis]
MSRPHADFVRARLGLWQRRIHETADFLVLAQDATPVAGMMPVFDQLVAVHNLTSGLVADLRQSAEGSLASTDAGRQYLSQLATALAHGSRAATHLSTAAIGLADAHRVTAGTGSRAPVESELAVTLGHAAALRSLNRALQAVTRRPAEPESGSGALPEPAVEHRRAPDAGGTHPSRRRT